MKGFTGFSGGGGANRGETGIGGVSAVNPQAEGNFQSFIDASYGAAKNRLDPRFKEENAAFNQQMINQGLPVGSAAQGGAQRNLMRNQNDAYGKAAFDAMGFGLGAQKQSFDQSATRSKLANDLLTSKWGFDEQGRQFDDSLTEKRYEFDSDLDKRYYDTDTQLDYAYDRANQDDYRWSAGQDRQDFYDAREGTRYDDAFMMQLMGMGGTPNVYTQDPTGAYNQQMKSGTSLLQDRNAAQTGMINDGMSAWKMSDERLKENVEFITEVNGHNVYRWDWNEAAKELGIDDPNLGVIAQEVEHTGCVKKMPNGYLAVNYQELFA